jgi:hypothetical protein
MRNDDGELSLNLTAIYNIELFFYPWFPPTEKLRIYSKSFAAYGWWSRGLERLSTLPDAPPELSGFVLSLLSLPLEVLGLIIAAGSSEIYRIIPKPCSRKLSTLRLTYMWKKITSAAESCSGILMSSRKLWANAVLAFQIFRQYQPPDHPTCITGAFNLLAAIGA